MSSFSSSASIHNTALPRHDFQTADFDFELPPELIAQHPAAERSASRLLDGTGALPVDRIFRDLPGLLREGDLLVFNDTRVVKARLFGEKPTGGKVELLVERVLHGTGTEPVTPDTGGTSSNADAAWEVACHMKVSKKPQPGTTLVMAGGAFGATLLGRWPDAAAGPLFRFRFEGPLGTTAYDLMERHGHVPLPPYITHTDSADDAQRYQTVFARVPGAVAAPTAALHFDADMLAALDACGVRRAAVTLHVGAGTFQPVKADRIADHHMHHERYAVPAATQEAIRETRARGGRIVAVGTTTVRTLESWAQSGDAEGDTNIFITPGFHFAVVDLLVTNFHLPRSTLMMMVSAFAGYEHIMALYRHAVAQRYRFFSYGDSMLLQCRPAEHAVTSSMDQRHIPD
jgi:S-adenosylmethionine:tRNA ribosyltransferase-isomerase